MVTSAFVGFLVAGLVAARPSLQPRDSLPNGCRAMANSDLSKLTDDEMKLILQSFNSQLNGQTVCSTGAQDFSVPWGCNLQKVKAGGFFGGLDNSGNPTGSDSGATGRDLNWNPNYVNAILHVPTNNQQADYGIQGPVVCLDEDAAWVVFNTDTSSCQYDTSTASGSTADAGTSVTVLIHQEDSVSYTYTTETSVDITAGLSYTFTAGVPETASNSITASLSVTVGIDQSETDGKEQTQSHDLSITVNPGAGQHCYVALSSTNCPGSAIITTPVTYLQSSSYGARTQFNAIVEFPKNRPDYATYNGQNEYFVGDFGSILYPNSTAQQNFVTEVQLAYSSSGNYEEECSCKDGSALIDGVCQGSLSTTTVTAHTSTVTPKTLTAYLSTVVEALKTVTKVPKTTKTVNTATSYSSTVHDITKQITASDAKVSTKLAKQIVTKLQTSTTTQIVSTSLPMVTETVKAGRIVSVTSVKTNFVATTTLHPTITKSLTKSTTVKQSGCTTVTKGQKKARDASQSSVITVTDYDHTLTVTDFSATATVTVSATLTSTDSKAVVTVTASITSTILDASNTFYIKGGVLTTPLVQTLSAFTTTVKTTSTLTSVVLQTAVSTSTVSAATTTVSVGGGKTTTKTIVKTVKGTSTVTAPAKTVTSISTKKVKKYSCTKTKTVG